MKAKARSDPQPMATPPRFADPRRIGALVGLAGSCVFVFSYAAELEDPLPLVAYIVVVVLVLATLWFLFVRPRWIGPFLPAKVWQIGVYLLCVVAELVLIGVGTRWLTALGEDRGSQSHREGAGENGLMQQSKSAWGVSR